MREMRKHPPERKTVERMIIHLGPYRSYSLPTRTRESAKMIICRKKAIEMALRFQPNSSMTGLKITPMEFLVPELKKRMTKEERTM
jgi:hypothetical protein